MPPFKRFSRIRVSLQAALSSHIIKQRYVLTKETCGMRLADFAKTELFQISLTKLGASVLLSKLG